MRRAGLTLVETIVVIAVLVILIALLLPAVQASREAARRVQCSSNLRQVGIAVAHYAGVFDVFPPGASANSFSFHVTLLPYMEQLSLSQLSTVVDFAQDADYGNLPLRRTLVQGYRCPSDSASLLVLFDRAATNYAGNFGTGVLRDGYNGIFQRYETKVVAYPVGWVSLGQVQDGLSNTACIAEVLVADGSYSRLRVNWATRNEFSKEQFAEFQSTCQAVQPSQVQLQLGGDVTARGRPWTFGDAGYTWYNHALSPNSPSCMNQNNVQTGIYSAASYHPGGINVVMADQHVKFISNQIASETWHAMGSRSQGDW